MFAYHEIVRSPDNSDDFDVSRCDVYYQGEVSPDFYGWVFPHGQTTSVGMGSANKGLSLRGATAVLRQRAGQADRRHRAGQRERRDHVGLPVPGHGDQSLREFVVEPFEGRFEVDDGRLDELAIVSRRDHADRNRYIDDFERLAERFRERHGQPALEAMRWQNSMFADRPERFGDAIAAGHLRYLARWDTADARILMALRGERYQVLHEIILRPPAGAASAAPRS